MASSEMVPNAPGEGVRVLLTGGGTGGHVFPALSVARELLERGCTVSYAGAAGGIEERLAGERHLPFHPLPVRPLVGQGLVGKARTLAVLARGGAAARRLIRRSDIAALFGTGGYVSAPAVLGARLAGRPSVLFEPNAHVGVANRYLSRLAREACIAYPEAQGALSCPVRLTGTPVRPEFFAAPEWQAPADQGSGGTPVLRLLVLGGSQGAAELNRQVPEALARLVKDSQVSIAVTHQCGPAHLEAARQAYGERLQNRTLALQANVVAFLDDIAGAMASSHLVITRGGAITLAEICAAGRPAVVLPLAAALGHQRGNAEALVDTGAAVIGGGEGGAPELALLLARLLADPERLAAMAQAARGQARKDAAAAIADRVLAAAAGGGTR